jgi:hypothetical protein
MAQDTDQCKALVNTAMNRRVDWKTVKFLRVLTSDVTSSRVELVR